MNRQSSNFGKVSESGFGRGHYRLLILLAALETLCSCATGRIPSSHRFQGERQDQAPELNLQLFHSPEQRPSKQDRNHHVVVAVSGGGHRAGNFAFGVLLELEKLECPEHRDALKEVDYFSTVSGGGFGVGAYLASLSDFMANAGNEGPELRRQQFQLSVESQQGPKDQKLFRQLERGYNNRAARAFLSLRATFSTLDRGDYLEETFDRFILGAEKRGHSMELNQLWVDKDDDKAKVLLPAWVANATVFQNGAIFPLTPDVLSAYGVASYTHAKKDLTIEGNQLRDYGKMPVSVAMKASASFPGLLPATTFSIRKQDTKNPYLHLEDGGLSDNLGLLTAASILRQLRGTEGSSALIIIDAFNGESEPFSKRKGSPKFYQSLRRSGSISLDSWHSRFQTLLRGFVGESTPAVHLGFSELDEDQEELHKRVLRIKTSINITPEERDSLFEAAKVIVQKKKPELCAAFFPSPN